MELKIKSMLAVSVMAAMALSFASCSDDDDDDANNNTEIEGTQANIDEACSNWKTSRQYWEWSEAFLFGVASNYGIDPHIDTWPFDKSAFDKYMSKYSPVTDESDAELLGNAIATGQNLTGFHAVEYLIYRKGEARNIADLTANELWFCQTAAEDLHYNSLRLVYGWGGELSEDDEAALEDGEDNILDLEESIGDQLVNAGQSGSTWKSATAGTRQIIDGCKNIIDEVENSKIGTPHTGEDINYIESPHAYNSVQDFYDNTVSCKNALYGKLGATTPEENSVMGYAKKYFNDDYTKIESAMQTALNKVNSIKKPFVLYYQDESAQEAMDALDAFSQALTTLYDHLGEYDGNATQEAALAKVNAQFVSGVAVPTYTGLMNSTAKLCRSLEKMTFKTK